MSSVLPLLRGSFVANMSGQDGGPSSTVDLATDAKTFMRRVLEDPTFQVTRQDAAVRPRRNYEMAFRLLEEAAMTLSSMQDRQEHLEASLASVQAQTSLKVEAAEDRVKEWQAFAVVLKTRLQDSEQRLAAMQERAQTAEAQAQAERARATAEEQREAEECALSRTFYDRIVAIFGNGSRAHAAFAAASRGLPSADPD